MRAEGGSVKSGEAGRVQAKISLYILHGRRYDKNKGEDSMGKMTVYHGSYVVVEKPQLVKGRNTKDFGPGFYCTLIREQAERWAKRYDSPVVNTYTVRMNPDLDILEFKDMTEEWLDFIINCRQGIAHSHDIVIGAMANDQIYNYIADYVDGIITRDQFWSLAKFKYPTHRINFCTDQTRECLAFVSVVRSGQEVKK